MRGKTYNIEWLCLARDEYLDAFYLNSFGEKVRKNWSPDNSPKVNDWVKVQTKMKFYYVDASLPIQMDISEIRQPRHYSIFNGFGKIIEKLGAHAFCVKFYGTEKSFQDSRYASSQIFRGKNISFEMKDIEEIGSLYLRDSPEGNRIKQEELKLTFQRIIPIPHSEHETWLPYFINNIPLHLQTDFNICNEIPCLMNFDLHKLFFNKGAKNKQEISDDRGKYKVKRIVEMLFTVEEKDNYNIQIKGIKKIIFESGMELKVAEIKLLKKDIRFSFLYFNETDYFVSIKNRLYSRETIRNLNRYDNPYFIADILDEYCTPHNGNKEPRNEFYLKEVFTKFDLFIFILFQKYSVMYWEDIF